MDEYEQQLPGSDLSNAAAGDKQRQIFQRNLKCDLSCQRQFKKKPNSAV
jgi:hypothetical protein